MLDKRQLIYILALLSSFALDSFVEAQATFKTSPHYIAKPYGARNSVREPRGIVRDDSGDILVISRATSQVIAIYEENDKVKTTVIVSESNLKLFHGIEYRNGYIYASNDTTVFRWRYRAGHRLQISSAAEIVVTGIPSGGDYYTRSLLIDANDYLYVSIGAEENVHEDSNRALIRRFNLKENIPEGGFTFNTAELFAEGVRNAVGLAVGFNNDIWGVDCGADELFRDDLGGDIHNTNPADELIRFKQGGKYGYPYCWTVGQLDKYKSGDQLAWPDFMKNYTDAWCQNQQNNIPPTMPLPAHNAPLGIIFYDGTGCSNVSGAFPCFMKGDAFIAFHGSWNSEPPTGYKVVRLPFSSGFPTGEIEDILYDPNPSTCVVSPTTCLRPVDLIFNQNGHLIVTSDTSDEIFTIAFKRSYTEVISEFLRVHVPGVLALILVILITVSVLGIVILKFCRCRNTTEVAYVREKI